MEDIMNLKVIEEKYKLLSKGATLTPKQMGYLENHYDSIRHIDSLIFHWSPDELVLFGTDKTIKDFEGIAGYDFSIDSASVFVKIGEESLIVITNKEDITFFKEVVIDILDNESIDGNGDYIENEEG